MTDLDALRQAVLAAPDDDLPRLVYADCLEENGDPDRAEFIRVQIELARQPEYEPFAVLCKARKQEWVTGHPWWATLPFLPSSGLVSWNGFKFHRGFGWSIQVSHLPAVHHTVVLGLLDQEPIGELLLHTATLDQWQEFATSEWLPRIRSLAFVSLTSPNEPLRVLRDSPNAGGVRSLRLDHTNVPSIPLILEDLFAAPLGRQLTALTMRHGYGSADEWVEAIASSGKVALTDFDLYQMGFGPAAARVFMDSKLARQAEVLRLQGNPLQSSGMEILATGVERLRVLDLTNTHLDADAAEVLAGAPAFAGVRKLVLNRNRLGTDGVKALARSEHLVGLRSVGLAVTQCDNAGVRYLTRGTFWPNLVELDLAGNRISDPGAKHLMTAKPAPELTSLRLPARNLSDGMIADLRTKFGEAVSFAE
jgi:uncharacterized protein (TIGR02996 family)